MKRFFYVILHKFNSCFAPHSFNEWFNAFFLNFFFPFQFFFLNFQKLIFFPGFLFTTASHEQRFKYRLRFISRRYVVGHRNVIKIHILTHIWTNRCQR